MSFDFFRISEQLDEKKGQIEVSPDFRVCRSKDLMVRANSFYAIWDEAAGLWSTDEYDVQRLVDEELWRYKDELQSKSEHTIVVRSMASFASNSWLKFRQYMKNLSDSSDQLDENLTFSNTPVKKEDFVSRRLPYALQAGDIKAYDELMSVLYEPEERAKLEWAIGAIVSGDAKKIQKFIVLYGSGGSGKGTVLEIIQSLFEGYYATFEAKAITGSSNAFATEAFKGNPLVAINSDGDLSKIEDNSKLNAISGHDQMLINEKYKPGYTARINAFLFVGSNKPVKITDAKSGLIRRLIDVSPSGRLFEPSHYHALMQQIQFELGAIAHHCLDVYNKMGRDYYSGYRPINMMLKTDVFFNFIEAHYEIFAGQDGVTLRQAYELYKQYVVDAGLEFKMPQYKFREELKNYFDGFEAEARLEDGTRVRSWYSGFHADHFKTPVAQKAESVFSLVMDEHHSLFDKEFADCPAQYAKEDGTPQKFWSGEERLVKGELYTPKPDQIVNTKLRDLDTSIEHYVKVPENHIVIDFDLRDPAGEKSAERNLEAASQWPATYAEFSKSGGGIHLHYFYDGDVSELARLYDDGIEIKVYRGHGSLRRRLSRCNNVPIATINSGLPLREKKVISQETVGSERALRDLVMRNLRKEIHPGTKPSMDFIFKILDDAYKSGMRYNLEDLRPKVFAFANNSTNQAMACIKLMQRMQFKSDHDDEGALTPEDEPDGRLAFYDVEVFPNLFVVCWKYEDAPDDQIVRMINPTPQQCEELLKLKLVGFYVRRYDNHILYARVMGYSNEQLFQLSQKIIDNVPGAMFGEAYGLSHVDIWDYASEKKSLKKWQIELGLRHEESELPWDEPVPDDKIEQVVNYCCNDVITTEQVHKSRSADYTARQILASLSGLSINDTTQKHTAKIVFGNDRKPQDKFVYTDLSQEFPGYKFVMGKSEYRDEDPKEGGYVYAEPGMYYNVALLDIASMHPTTIEVLNAFGDYTQNFSDLVKARLAIKRGQFDEAREMLDGKLAPFLHSEDEADKLSYALKIVINIVYGLTSAKFDNPFRDPRNIDNIVAKRGALFMIELKHMVQEAGYGVAHIKTDSIKIPDADDNIIDLVMQFGRQYGYTFEHEETYDKFCLVNDAVYIAKTRQGKKPPHWVATGAQFAHPYVFKTLFSGEEIVFDDLCETKTVTTALYLKFEGDQQEHFVGKAGRFVPVKEGTPGAGELVREKDGKFYAASNTKGYLWMEAEIVRTLQLWDSLDMTYYERLIEDARAQIEKYGDIEQFID